MQIISVNLNSKQIDQSTISSKFCLDTTMCQIDLYYLCNNNNNTSYQEHIQAGTHIQYQFSSHKLFFTQHKAIKTIILLLKLCQYLIKYTTKSI